MNFSDAADEAPSQTASTQRTDNEPGGAPAVGELPGRAAHGKLVAMSSAPVAIPSLEELNGTVAVPPAGAGFWRQWRAFVGPAVLVSVGYMDPGNWATDLQAGATFRYGLLWVVALSSVMAIIMQVCAAKLGVVMRKDLAQACRDHLPGWTRWPNWLSCELAIGACDLAEVLGSAVALNLLFGIPLFWAVLITAFDVLLLLTLQGMGMRLIEALILVLVGTIGACYFIELFVLPRIAPDFLEMGRAVVTPTLAEAGMVYVAIGIIGATVMPHNLYLHSALVQSRRVGTDDASLRRAIRFNTLDSVIALSIAFFVNAAILVMAAVVLHPHTHEVDPEPGAGLGADAPGPGSGADDDKDIVVTHPDGRELYKGKPDWIRIAYQTLAPLLGTALAGILFAVALLASGQSSTITGTMAGQVVMEGFLRWQIRPWVRRLVTRMLAILPAVFVIGWRGESSSVTDLLTLSQVVLAMQLPLAMFPLLYFSSSTRHMGQYRNGWWLLVSGWATCVLITVLDLYGLPDALAKAWEFMAGP
jgi:manganese transport protein